MFKGIENRHRTKSLNAKLTIKQLCDLCVGADFPINKITMITRQLPTTQSTLSIADMVINGTNNHSGKTLGGSQSTGEEFNDVEFAIMKCFFINERLTQCACSENYLTEQIINFCLLCYYSPYHKGKRKKKEKLKERRAGKNVRASTYQLSR